MHTWGRGWVWVAPVQWNVRGESWMHSFRSLTEPSDEETRDCVWLDSIPHVQLDPAPTPFSMPQCESTPHQINSVGLASTCCQHHVAGTYSQRMDVETIGSCREDGRGEKAHRLEAEIRKPSPLLPRANSRSNRAMDARLLRRPNSSGFSDCVCDANGA